MRAGDCRRPCRGIGASAQVKLLGQAMSTGQISSDSLRRKPELSPADGLKRMIMQVAAWARHSALGMWSPHMVDGSCHELDARAQCRGKGAARPHKCLGGNNYDRSMARNRLMRSSTLVWHGSYPPPYSSNDSWRVRRTASRPQARRRPFRCVHADSQR